MQTEEFLRHVLPLQGVYCVVGKDPSNKIVPKFVHSIEEAAKLAERMAQGTNDVYFACSSFLSDTERTKANAAQQKALWLDLDCGFDGKKNKFKDYKTKDAALQGLRKFTDETGLPEPTIVDSGNGIHCYWTFTEAIDKALWTPVAEGLKFLCAKHGLRADPSCTADSARILRVPNTANYKDINNPQPVIVLVEGYPTPFDDIAALIPVHLGGERVKLNKEPNEVNKALLDNNQAFFKKIMTRTLSGEGCEQLKYIATKQREIDEPLWRSGLSIAQFCEDREIAIHKISSQHPEYNAAATERKAASIPKPHTCAQFESLRPEGCANCRFKGSITSPIQLGKTIARAKGADNIIMLPDSEGKITESLIPEYPEPYFRGKHGGIYKPVDEEGTDGMKICDYDFFLVDRLNDPTIGDCAWFKLILPQDGVREFIAPVSQIMSTEKAREIVNNIGIFSRGKPLEAIIEYMRFALDAKLKSKKAALMHKQFGWSDDKSSIIIGNRHVSAYGVATVPVSDELSQITTTLNKKGSYEEWKKAIAYYERPGLELRAFGFFCGFGSLLMPLFDTREKSAVVNLYNPDPGQGKTSVLQMMTSIYGNPDIESKLINVWGDTENSIINRLGYMKNLPAAVDEMTNVSPDALHNFLKFISSGRGRNRMGNGVNSERTNNTVFNLICVVSSNTDFRTVMFSKKAKASGEMARFIQLRIEKAHDLTKAEIDELLSKIFDNYGHAGEIFAHYVVSNLDAVKKELVEIQVKIDKLMGFKGEERKYSTTLASAFLGAKLAKQLGIHNIQIQPVLDAVKVEIDRFVGVIKDNDFDAMETLGNFLDENLSRNTLVINGIPDKRTGMLDMPIVKPSNELKVRFEPDMKTLYIPCSILKTYLNSVQVEYNDFVKGLNDMNVLKKDKAESKVMHMGLGMSGPAVKCLWIDSSKFDVEVQLDIPQNVN